MWSADDRPAEIVMACVRTAADTPSSGRLSDFMLSADGRVQHVERDEPPFVNRREFVERRRPGLARDINGSHDSSS